jgi:hypothetical protein
MSTNPAYRQAGTSSGHFVNSEFIIYNSELFWYKKIFAEKHINKIGLKSIDFYKSFVITQVMSVLYSSFLYVISTKMDLNKVMLIGRATNNLQVKSIESSGTPVANFTVATNRKFKNRDGNLLEDAEYHRCVAYGK